MLKKSRNSIGKIKNLNPDIVFPSNLTRFDIWIAVKPA